MIFYTIQECAEWTNKNLVKPGDKFIDGLVLEIHPEKTLKSILWRSGKARDYGVPVFAFMFGRNWKLVREKLVGVPYIKDYDFRTKEQVIELAKRIERIVDYVIIIDPDSIDPKLIKVDYDPLTNSEMTEEQKKLMSGCYAMTYILRSFSSNARIKRRMFFVMDGPMYFFGSRATEKGMALDREIVVVTDILRNDYKLVESAISEVVIGIISKEWPDLMEDVYKLHSVSVDLVNGKTKSLNKLKYFKLDETNTMAYTGSPLPEGGVLHHIFYVAKNRFKLKDVIYKAGK